MFGEVLKIQQVNSVMWKRHTHTHTHTHTHSVQMGLSVSHDNKGYCAVWLAVGGDSVL